MPQITIYLKSSEKDALRILAEQEIRDIRSQAALIIRRELSANGLLDTKENIQPTQEVQPVQAGQEGKNAQGS
jgi:hypothetical protein